MSLETILMCMETIVGMLVNMFVSCLMESSQLSPKIPLIICIDHDSFVTYYSETWMMKSI